MFDITQRARGLNAGKVTRCRDWRLREVGDLEVGRLAIWQKRWLLRMSLSEGMANR